MTLGEQIQSLRKTAGFSQEELGDRLGVARQSVSKWESDTTVPELEKLIAMSKLFGVSMGTLLGLEEGQETGQELTERELAAVEEIARRLVPPEGQETETVQKPRKRWPRLVAGAAVVLAAAILIGRINNLENQINSLHYNISNMDNTVSRQIGSLTNQVRDILEEQNSVTAGKDYQIAAMDLVNAKVTFALTATPREYREGMTAVFFATGPDFEAVEIPGTLGAGQTFTADLVCPLTDDITLSVAFALDGATVTQQIGQIGYLRSDTQVSAMGNLGWSVSDMGEGYKFTALAANAWLATTGEYKTRDGWQEVTIVKGTLRLWRGDTLFWSQECEDLTRRGSGHEVAIPTEGLSLTPGEEVVLSLLYTDSAGREEEVYLDGLQVMEDGRPSIMAPYEEGWKAPWEK